MTWTNALYSYIANLANFQVLFYLPIYFQPSTASRLLRAASTPFRVRNRCLRGRSVFTTSVVGSSLGVYPRFRVYTPLYLRHWSGDWSILESGGGGLANLPFPVPI
ncbi:hypothetical protein V1505DRAFT_371757, partial [Lipomyces doorenjongii]